MYIWVCVCVGLHMLGNFRRVQILYCLEIIDRRLATGAVRRSFWVKQVKFASTRKRNQAPLLPISAYITSKFAARFFLTLLDCQKIKRFKSGNDVQNRNKTKPTKAEQRKKWRFVFIFCRWNGRFFCSLLVDCLGKRIAFVGLWSLRLFCWLTCGRYFSPPPPSHPLRVWFGWNKEKVFAFTFHFLFVSLTVWFVCRSAFSNRSVPCSCLRIFVRFFASIPRLNEFKLLF